MSPTTTTYGTITSTTTPASSRFKHTRRPWREIVSLSSFSLPISAAEAKARIKLNISYFLVTYVIIMLIIVFLTLLWHPISMIVFLITFIFWWFFYLFNENPVVVFNKTVNDNVILGFLSFATVLLLVITHVGVNVLVGLVIGVVVVGVHAAFRGTEDLGFVGEEEEENGLLSVVVVRILVEDWLVVRVFLVQALRNMCWYGSYEVISLLPYYIDPGSNSLLQHKHWLLTICIQCGVTAKALRYELVSGAICIQCGETDRGCQRLYSKHSLAFYRSCDLIL
ncbi:hypothetical protein REPUB_Repub16aG0116300 [Reevesia pubescens]